MCQLLMSCMVKTCVTSKPPEVSVPGFAVLRLAAIASRIYSPCYRFDTNAGESAAASSYRKNEV